MNEIVKQAAHNTARTKIEKRIAQSKWLHRGLLGVAVAIGGIGAASNQEGKSSAVSAYVCGYGLLGVSALSLAEGRGVRRSSEKVIKNFEQALRPAVKPKDILDLQSRDRVDIYHAAMPGGIVIGTTSLAEGNTAAGAIFLTLAFGVFADREKKLDIMQDYYQEKLETIHQASKVVLTTEVS